MLKPPAGVPFDDRPLMAAGVLGFGISIPLLTRLYGDLAPGDPRVWAGALGFVALAAAIWLGNRWLLFKQRQHFDWFANPWRKLAMLVTANVVYTAPLTVASLYAWFVLAGLAVDRQAIQLVALTNVICVIFVTHAYETVFLIRERESDFVRVERLERLRAEAELAALKTQIDPHFLFNCLNTLGHLIRHDAVAGRAFCDALAELYRVVLAFRRHDRVSLGEELELVHHYRRLLALRFGAAISVEVDAALQEQRHRWTVPPLALQMLVENAVKHNQLGADAPLAVRLALQGETVEVSNRAQPRSSHRASTGLGLANLDERCRLLSGRGIEVVDAAGSFSVRVPLRAAV